MLPTLPGSRVLPSPLLQALPYLTRPSDGGSGYKSPWQECEERGV